MASGSDLWQRWIATVTPHFLDVSKRHQTLFSIVKGVRNGAVYGAKIRFPHALVMTFLFRSGTLREKFQAIFNATKAHSRNLASFVFIYKSLMAIQKVVRGKEENAHPFLAGLVGGYIVFGENNNINNQIVLYLFSRVMVGLAKVGAEQMGATAPSGTWGAFAALMWALVMWLFRHHRHVLQPSLTSSMIYLYDDSNQWNSLRNFFWHNK